MACAQHLGRSDGGGGPENEGLGPFSTSKAMASPHGKWVSKWQCTSQTPAYTQSYLFN